MLNKFLFSSVLSAGLCGFLLSPPVLAQECGVNFEMVTKLFHPDPGSYAVWQTNFGEADRAEEFTSIVLPIDSDKGAIAAGELRVNENSPPSLMLVRVDHRGRPVWEKYLPVEGLKHVLKILQRPEGYLVAANAKDGLWLGFFNPEGLLLESKSIAETGYVLSATDLVSDPHGKGWAIAITKEKTEGVGKNASVRREGSVYLIDTKGAVTLRRAFSMGGDNEILGLAQANFANDKSGYIATGYLENSQKKKMAIVLRLDQDVSLVWQQEYGRGLNAQMGFSSGFLKKYILAFGDVRPLDAGAIGSWLMLLDADDGKVLWQRYYNGETGIHDYRARGLYINKDSLVTLLMEAKVAENSSTAMAGQESDKNKIEGEMVGDIKIPDRTNYAHVLTLSPRGVTLSGDSYFQGMGVTAAQIIEGPGGERMIVGSTMAKASEASVPRDFKPDWDSDFAYGPNPLKPSPEGLDTPKVNLPEGEMSDKAKSGLALLNKKLKLQRQKDEEIQAELDKNQKNVQENNDSNEGVSGDSVSKNSWIVVGESPSPYVDPCKTPITDLTKQ